ncbi:THUMP-like domain-containing protein [Rhodoflexus sp.]
MKIFKKLLKSEVQAYIQAHLYEDTRGLLLKKSPFPDLEMRDIVAQIQAKRKAKSKLPAWFAASGLIFPPLLNMEQSSSEATARFKASLMQGNRLTDLTGGFGIDASFWAESFAAVDYVERNEELANIAAHNFEVLGKHNVRVHVADALQWLKEQTAPLECVYIDPARRDGVGNKVFRLSDCEPAVAEILPLLAGRARQLLIKTSPMLDISAALADLEQIAGWQVATVTVLALNNECKEVLYHLEATDEVIALQMKTVNLCDDKQEEFSFSPQEEQAAIAEFAMPQSFFCEPNAALLKAGAFKILAQRLHLQKLHQHTHLYTSAQRPENFPGRVFRLKAVCKADRKAIQAHLPDGKANLAVRNFPATVAELRKRWGIAEGGGSYLFAVTLADGQKAVLIGEKD